MTVIHRAVAGALLCLSAHAHATLSPTETAIADHVATTTPYYLSLLARLVDTPSGTLNHDGVRAVGDIMAKELTRLGFVTQWVTLPPALDRAGHLMAHRPGGRGPALLLIGHLDTVFDGDLPLKRFAIDGNRATGHGVQDMKGGLVMMLQALEALHAQGALGDAAITVALMGDEEKTGRPSAVSRAPLVEAAKGAYAALGFEFGAARLDESAVVARRGLTKWQLDVTSSAGHSSLQFTPEYGAGAVLSAARLLDGLAQQVRHYPDVTFNPGLMVAGTRLEHQPASARAMAYGKSNVIAAEATVEGDMRFAHPDQVAALQRRFRTLTDAVPKPARATLQFGEIDPAMPDAPRHRALLTLLSQVSDDLGLGTVTAQDPLRRGTADIAYVADRLPALDGLGAVGEGAHSDNESIDLTAYPAAVQRAALLIHRLVSARRAPAPED
ncbi:TPA: M20/M25/M40 family metallo-hydrolase [Aeromonas hydrophila]